MTEQDRAAQKAASLWLKTKTEFAGNWHIDLDDQAIIVNAVAAELSKAYAEIEILNSRIATEYIRGREHEQAARDTVHVPRIEQLKAEIARLQAREQAYEFIQRTYDEREKALGEAYAKIHNLRAELAKVKPASVPIIREHDIVSLLVALPAEGLVAGASGSVVHLYADGCACEVEFITTQGSKVVTLSLNQIQPTK